MWILFLGAVLDLLLGDPHALWHPVQGIGMLITAAEAWCRRLPVSEKIGGGILVVCVSAVTTGVAALLIFLGGLVHPWVKIGISVILTWQALAMTSLRTESMKVYQALKRGDTEGARSAVSMIVGRDTSVLDEEGISKAAIETVAENASDGVIAPLLFMLAFGCVGGWFYKSINTMDSMIGYKNEKYRRFGTAAARMDDLVNLLPSRLAALMMILSAFLLPGFDGRAAWRIWRRDSRKHASPNSAQTESACAGALHLRLAGDAVYFGKRVEKPWIGDDDRSVETEDIARANDLMMMASVLTFLAGCLILTLLWRLG